MAVVLPIPEPRGFSSWNRSLQGAYRKGVLARLEGLTLRDCPYRDTRKPDGRLSWSRSFITAWRDGYVDAQRHQEGQS